MIAIIQLKIYKIQMQSYVKKTLLALVKIHKLLDPLFNPRWQRLNTSQNL